VSESPNVNPKSQSDDSDPARPLLEHLEELRVRIIYSILYLAGGFFIGLFLAQSRWLFQAMMSPIQSIPDVNIVVLGPTDKFAAYFKVAFIAGVAFALPFMMHQLWMFLRPGLSMKERRMAQGLIPASLILFLIGAAFVFFVMIPSALKFLINFDLGVEVKTMLSLDRYFSFILYLLLAGGLVFQIPLITWFLARAGVLTSRLMARNRKYAILGAAILAAVLTPTGDPFNFALLGVPIYALYEISIVVAMVSGKKKNHFGV
jgi:sec-independent protein translocase protein TatC